MSHKKIHVATIWNDATSFGSPLERRWFSSEEAAYDWTYNSMSGCDWWHVEEIECGDEPDSGEDK